jgi:hypothetical protein
VGRACLFLAALHILHPYRNPGVQRFSTIMAAFRVFILFLSVGLISDTRHGTARDLGRFIASMHVICCVLVALLCCVKLFRTWRGRHDCGAGEIAGANPEATGGSVGDDDPVTHFLGRMLAVYVRGLLPLSLLLLVIAVVAVVFECRVDLCAAR